MAAGEVAAKRAFPEQVGKLVFRAGAIFGSDKRGESFSIGFRGYSRHLVRPGLGAGLRWLLLICAFRADGPRRALIVELLRLPRDDRVSRRFLECDESGERRRYRENESIAGLHSVARARPRLALFPFAGPGRSSVAGILQRAYSAL